MQIRDINKPVTSKTLNETLAKKFGTRLDTDSFTLEQLQDARNKIRTKLSQIETNESFSGLPKNQTYSKNKLFLDILNAAISERSNISEAKKCKCCGDTPCSCDDDCPDCGGKGMYEAKRAKDQDEDGDKDFADVQIARMVKSGMSKADAIKKVKNKDYNEAVKESSFDPVIALLNQALKDAVESGNQEEIEAFTNELRKRGAIPGGGLGPAEPDSAPSGAQQLPGRYDDLDGSIRDRLRKMAGESIVREGAEDHAELVMAAKDMVDRLTGWMEDTAEMQTESMLELADAIRDEMGQAESDTFVNTVKPALESLYAAMEATRTSLTQGVGQLTGEGGAPAADMGAPVDDIPADVEPEETEMEPTVDDEFAAAAPAAGGTEEAGRARRESKYYKKKAMLEQARRLGSILSKKK